MTRFRALVVSSLVAFFGAAGVFANASPNGSPSPRAPESRITMRLLRLEPGDTTTVDRKRPEISATFAETIDPKTVRVTIDRRDVSPETFVSERSFVYLPNFNLTPGTHDVTVDGKTPDRESFSERWTFTTRAGERTNFISGLEPPSGTRISSPLVLSAFTRPGGHVRIVTMTSEMISNFSDVTGGSSTTDIVADAHGYFEARIVLPERTSEIVDVRIVATSAAGGLAVRTLRLRQLLRS